MDRAIRQQAQPRLPKVIPGRDRVPWKSAVQAAEIIVRVAFRRGFVKVAVPLNLDPYHTALVEKETRVGAQEFLEQDSSHRAALHRELYQPGDVLMPGVSPAGAPFWKKRREKAQERLGKVCC